MANFVSVESNANKVKMKNLFHTGIFIGFVWLLFHFTIIFFFGLILESVLLVGLFLALGNIVALFVDIPIGVLQKYIHPKIFMYIANSCMFFVTLIFLKFVYFEGISEILPGGSGAIQTSIFYVGEFLNSTLNIILLIIAACLYGIIKESYDVTSLSYIFNNTSPSEYANHISKYSIYFSIGAILGLIFSGILLSWNIQGAIITFIGVILIFYLFLRVYFDNEKKTIKLQDFKNMKLDITASNISKKRVEITKNITTKNFLELSKQTKLILLKPIEIRKNINFQDVVTTTTENFSSFCTIIFSKPRNVVILWIIFILMQYGFWDTFVSTFQIDFLEKVLQQNRDSFIVKGTGGFLNGYLFLGLLVIPAFALQDYFIGLSKKIGVFKVIMLGTFLSAISLFLFGIMEGKNNIIWIILFGLINSVGYAAVMPIGQAIFSEIYNVEYTKKFHTNQIDTTVSAAPLKIILNTANVMGLLFGSFIVSTMGFNMFFVVFSLTLFSLFIFSVINMKLFNVKIEIETPGKQEIQAVDKDFV